MHVEQSGYADSQVLTVTYAIIAAVTFHLEILVAIGLCDNVPLFMVAIKDHVYSII